MLTVHGGLLSTSVRRVGLVASDPGGVPLDSHE